jgi:hypothetical protein
MQPTSNSSSACAAVLLCKHPEGSWAGLLTSCFPHVTNCQLHVASEERCTLPNSSTLTLMCLFVCCAQLCYSAWLSCACGCGQNIDPHVLLLLLLLAGHRPSRAAADLPASHWLCTSTRAGATPAAQKLGPGRLVIGRAAAAAAATSIPLAGSSSAGGGRSSSSSSSSAARWQPVQSDTCRRMELKQP